MKWRLTLLLLACLLVFSCGDDDSEGTNSRSPTSPDAQPVTTVNALDMIEFRVIGNASMVAIRYTTSIDGTSQVTTGLPFQVTLRSNRERLFLSLDVATQTAAVGALNTYVIAQIFVNGQLFREAYGSGVLPSVNASGTFTHGQLQQPGQ